MYVLWSFVFLFILFFWHNNLSFVSLINHYSIIPIQQSTCCFVLCMVSKEYTLNCFNNVNLYFSYFSKLSYLIHCHFENIGRGKIIVNGGFLRFNSTWTVMTCWVCKQKRKLRPWVIVLVRFTVTHRSVFPAQSPFVPVFRCWYNFSVVSVSVWFWVSLVAAFFMYSLVKTKY